MSNFSPRVPWAPERGKAGFTGPYAHLLKLIDPADPAITDIVRAIFDSVAVLMAIGEEPDEAVVTTAIRVGRAHYRLLAELEQREAPPEPEPGSEEGVVYYIRRGETIKIGTTVRLRQRMQALMPDEILATEPGSYELERYRHRQFRHLRLSGSEYFAIADDLLQYVATLREEHGIPDQTLATFPQLPEQQLREQFDA